MENIFKYIPSILSCLGAMWFVAFSVFKLSIDVEAKKALKDTVDNLQKQIDNKLSKDVYNTSCLANDTRLDNIEQLLHTILEIITKKDN